MHPLAISTQQRMEALTGNVYGPNFFYRGQYSMKTPYSAFNYDMILTELKYYLVVDKMRLLQLVRVRNNYLHLFESVENNDRVCFIIIKAVVRQSLKSCL